MPRGEGTLQTIKISHLLKVPTTASAASLGWKSPERMPKKEKAHLSDGLNSEFCLGGQIKQCRKQRQIVKRRSFVGWSTFCHATACAIAYLAWGCANNTLVKSPRAVSPVAVTDPKIRETLNCRAAIPDQPRSLA